MVCEQALLPAIRKGLLEWIDAGGPNQPNKLRRKSADRSVGEIWSHVRRFAAHLAYFKQVRLKDGVQWRDDHFCLAPAPAAGLYRNPSDNSSGEIDGVPRLAPPVAQPHAAIKPKQSHRVPVDVSRGAQNQFGLRN